MDLMVDRFLVFKSLYLIYSLILIKKINQQMANFKAFKDLHDFNRKLHEDDWNNGQHFQLKLKNGFKNANGSCVSIFHSLFNHFTLTG